MLRVLTAIRVTGEYFEKQMAYKFDSASAVIITRGIYHMQRAGVVLRKPLPLNDVESSGILVPVEFVQRNVLIRGAKQIVSAEQNSVLVHHPPHALHMKFQSAALDFVPMAVEKLVHWAELENLHVGSTPTITDRFAYENTKLSGDSICEYTHRCAEIANLVIRSFRLSLASRPSAAYHAGCELSLREWHCSSWLRNAHSLPTAAGSLSGGRLHCCNRFCYTVGSSGG